MQGKYLIPVLSLIPLCFKWMNSQEILLKRIEIRRKRHEDSGHHTVWPKFSRMCFLDHRTETW